MIYRHSQRDFKTSPFEILLYKTLMLYSNYFVIKVDVYLVIGWYSFNCIVHCLYMLILCSSKLIDLDLKYLINDQKQKKPFVKLPIDVFLQFFQIHTMFLFTSKFNLGVNVKINNVFLHIFWHCYL